MEEIALVSLERVSGGSVFPQNILTAVKKRLFTQTNSQFCDFVQVRWPKILVLLASTR